MPDYGLCSPKARTLKKEEKLRRNNRIKACGIPERLLLILSFLHFQLGNLELGNDIFAKQIYHSSNILGPLHEHGKSSGTMTF